MVVTKDLQLARYTYANSEKAVGEALERFNGSIAQLLELKRLLKCGFVKRPTYQSYKKTTANYRKLLQIKIKQARRSRHEAWTIYDKMQLEYNKQNQKETILQDTLQKLNAEQKQALREYFLQSN